jgi:hypothetical protein
VKPGRVVRKTIISRPGFFAAGAVLMYFCDPDRGRTRRTRTAAQAKAAGRHQIHRVVGDSERQARYLRGRAKGAVIRATGGGQYHPESDVDLREHLRQVIHSLPMRDLAVNVDVAKGVATLRGQVGSVSEQSGVRAAVAAVPGVVRVEDLTHLPGDPAPNKASALGVHASQPATPTT